MYSSVNQQTQQWNMTMAVIAGVCGVVAVGSVGSLLSAPQTTQLYAPAQVQVRAAQQVRAPVNYQGQAQQAAARQYAQAAQAQEEFYAPEEIVQAVPAQSPVATWAPLAGLMAIPAAIVALLLRKQENIKVAAAGAGAAALMATAPAMAGDIKLGGDNGQLAFVPSSLTVKAGETVTWTNNAGFPHNIVFDEDEIPEGVKADSLSHEDYLNAKGDQVSTTFNTAGSYSYYCEPHQGAGMQGKIIVE
jgi:plastocyanin